MLRKVLIGVFLFSVVCFFFPVGYTEEESITFTTYYPSPYGSYNQLQTNFLGVGDNNRSGSLDSGDTPPIDGSQGSAWFAGNVGIGTTNPRAALEIFGGVMLGVGQYTGTGSPPVTGAGTRFMWIPSLGAIRAGGVVGTQWDTIGVYSVAFGVSNTASGTVATVGGGWFNTANDSLATVGGGYGNTASGFRATVGGGFLNTAGSGWHATVGGGYRNTASAESATVGGGYGNTASDLQATVGGGYGNTASGSRATVGGGDHNTASGAYSTVPGGDNNVASGAYSFAAGRRAKANTQGSFVWADSQDADLISTTANQFLVRSQGGFYVNSSSVNFVNAGSSRLYIQNTGNVGIGTAEPGAYKLYVAGNGYITGIWTQNSDERLKRIVFNIDNPTEKLIKLNGVKFEWKREEYPDKGLPEGIHYGLVAQEVEKVFPEVVREDDQGYKALSYTELIPILIEVIKQQESRIKALEARLEN